MKHSLKLAALPQEGSTIHIVADCEIHDNSVEVMTVCGRLMDAQMLLDIPHNIVSCQRCRSNSAHYNHRVGKVT